MDTIHFLLRLMALSQVLLLFLYLIIYQRHTVGALVSLLLFSFGCYLIAPLNSDPYPGYRLIILMATASPSFLWLLARFFFYDDKRIPHWFWLISVSYLALSLLNWESIVLIADTNLNSGVLELLPQLAKLGLVLHVFYMALDGRANDLVSQRLKLRVPIALGGSVLTALIILVEIALMGQIPIIVEVMGSLLIFVTCLGGNLYLLRLREDLSLTMVERVTTAPAANSPHDTHEEIEQIRAAMEDNRFYANHGATIGDLSEQLSIVEYRLRPMINQGMGFRNFNQFLNAYRIDEASSRLISEPKLPIISIALDVGFKSLSSFNKAFRDKHGKTPSEFRLIGLET